MKLSDSLESRATELEKVKALYPDSSRVMEACAFELREFKILAKSIEDLPEKVKEAVATVKAECRADPRILQIDQTPTARDTIYITAVQTACDLILMELGLN